MITFITLSIFGSIKGYLGAGLLSAILGIGAIKKKALIADKWAKIVSKILGIVIVTATDAKAVTDKIDEAIADDASVNAKTLKEAFELGKRVKIDIGNAIVEIKAKKQADAKP